MKNKERNGSADPAENGVKETSESSTRDDQKSRRAHHKGGKTFFCWGITGTLLLLSIVLIVVGAVTPEEPPEKLPPKLSSVGIMNVKPGTYLESLNLPAKIEADRHAVISSELNGRLAEWRVAEGASVEKNQVIAVLDLDRLNASLAQATVQLKSFESGVVVARKKLDMAEIGLKQSLKDVQVAESGKEAVLSDLTLSKKEFDRIEALVKENVATDSILDKARNVYERASLAVADMKEKLAQAGLSVESATLQVDQAEAGLALAQSDLAAALKAIAAINVELEKSRIKAPFAGRLEEHIVEAGDVVGVGEPLSHLYDLSYVRAIVDVADRYIPFLDYSNFAVKEYISMSMPGAIQEIHARVILPGLPKLTGGTYSGISMDATIHRTALAADSLSNTFKVELRLKNPGKAFKHGMVARASIDYLKYPGSIVIPVSAIQVAEKGPRALVVENVDGKEICSVRNIEAVSIKDDHVLVASGIKGGDRIISTGGKGVIHGEQVEIRMIDGVITNQDFTNGKNAR